MNIEIKSKIEEGFTSYLESRPLRLGTPINMGLFQLERWCNEIRLLGGSFDFCKIVTFKRIGKAGASFLYDAALFNDKSSNGLYSETLSAFYLQWPLYTSYCDDVRAKLKETHNLMVDIFNKEFKNIYSNRLLDVKEQLKIVNT